MSEAKHTELQAGEYLTQQEAWGRISELESRNTALVEALEAALEWIDSVPDDVQLPAMPGFDRDHVDNVLKQAKGES